jgi:sugar phosphate isomerase/epimerase
MKDAVRMNGVAFPRLPGEGDVDLAEAVRLLKQSGYNGYYSFEWEKWYHPELADPEISFAHYVNYCKQLP